MNRYLYISILFLLTNYSFSQTDSAKVKRNTKCIVASETILYTGSFVGLYALWYKDYNLSTFHFFDDSKEWLQIDKCGHFYSTFWTSKLNTELFLLGGTNKRKSVLLGTGISLLYISTIEVMDGFSENWGASVSDLIVNTAGASLFAAQRLSWGEERILFKYSYFPSDYAQYRPDLLGETFTEKLLKDYNATTFWLSFNLYSFTKFKVIPKWLNLAIGYGADGMTGGSENYFDSECNCYPIANNQRVRQFYLSFDVDLSKIKTKSRFINSVLYTLNSMKFPFPVLEMSSKDTRFQWYR